jgi:HD-GYP domain-containing protein (c-di-GMP phosphodiesterase class II)
MIYMDDNRFMTIPPGAIIPGSLPKFKIYMRSPKGQYMLWARNGNEVTQKQLAKLTESGIKDVFVHLEEEVKYEEYLENHLGTILENKASSNEQKASIFSKVSTHVVKDAFENSLGLGTMSQDVLQRTHAMVTNALMFITQAGSLQALAKMIGHDYQTYEHATKVLWFTVAFLKDNPFILERIEPEYPKFDPQQRMEMLRQCGVGALLHDIGKAFVSADILNKNEVLTQVEWEIMKRHPLHGLAMLLDTEIPEFVKKAVLHHHEDFAGGGYPMGLEGANISLLARVIRIVDVFDAMTSRRPYKDPIPPGKAVQIMVGTPPNKEPGENGNGKVDRDDGMRRCFDEELLRKFIVFLGNVRLTF